MLDRLAGRLIELIDRRSWMRRFVFVPALLLAVACDNHMAYVYEVPAAAR